MATLIERCLSLWERIRETPTFQPTAIAIPAGHVDRPAGQLFQRGQQYFQVRVNEMFLPYQRRWVSAYVPMVMALTEFQYDHNMTAVPFVVGPALVEAKGIQLANNGVLLQDTRVAGLNPYTGGRVATTMVLYRLERENFARKLLSVVESTAGALDFGTTLGVYLKIASAILDGIEAMLDTGQVQPLMGYRKEFDPDGADNFSPGYFALLNNSDGKVDPGHLWVKDNRLCYGTSLDKAISLQDQGAGRNNPLQEIEFVLYSIAQTDDRSDVELLPFYPLWERVQNEATQPGDDHYKSAKANMLSLYQTMTISPDLTEPQAGRLLDEFVQKMQQLHARAADLDALGAPVAPPQPPDPDVVVLERVIDRAVAILDL